MPKSKEPKDYVFIYRCFELAMQQSSFIPPFEKEFRFDPRRKWMADYAWIGHMPKKYRLIVEIEGGFFIEHKTVDGKPGGHNRGKAMLKDIEKYNTASLEGFHLLRFTPTQVEKGEAVQVIETWFCQNVFQ